MGTHPWVGEDMNDKGRSAYITRTYGELVGRYITSVRPLRQNECEMLGWEYEHSEDACVFILDNGAAFIPMADPEGNGAGALMLADVA